ncbi:timeless protein-domain-containing protein [Lipomyces tetrasporus]|uniref:Topoisomerase 1-associated factor 1 n=1 Tax=Lipomyces tetrasporus TaxID=54092 RepID=A0AAD7VVD2_9ASCO|nr:timeless protein-domain-containing protein [Lipomyces tetrasporus]KAJ8102866.1 timeless protein-domain-containing protein [Lipomyces tetrasporus]
MDVSDGLYDQLEVIDVDPTVRAHVTSLISALGGPDHSLPDDPYVLGDDALACLKDLKRWLKAYDEKLNRLEVARTIAETSLVTEDLLHILTNTTNEFRIALACVELLVPLTWPLQLRGPRNTMATNKHKPHVERAQRLYKHSIISHPSQKVLQAVACIALPSIALTHRERTPRDEGIIRLVLYFFRNIAMIESSSDSVIDDGLTSTILEFARQSIFDLVIALGSGVSDALRVLDLQLLELVFHIVKGVDPDTLHSIPSVSFITAHTQSAHSWLRLENGSELKPKIATTRHNRFGTMTSLVVADKTRLTVSGQQALEDSGSAIDKIDALKKWRRPQGGFRRPNDDLEKPTLISGEAQNALAKFVDEFLDSAFNPLFISIRKEIERESSRVEDCHEEQFLYLVSWFLSAELARQRATPNADHGFALVAGVLDQQSLVIVTKILRAAVDNKHMRKLGYAMHCFKQIILITSEMSASDVETDQEIAVNMISRLFYEEATLDLLASLPNVLHGASVPLMAACCDLVYMVLKILESYSKQNTHLYIRGRRQRARRSKGSNSPGEANDKGYTMLSSDEDDSLAQQKSSERAFEFARFERKFFTQNCIDMFRSVLVTHADLSDQQIKRIISFFHRIFFKREEEPLLYRLDFMLVLHRLLDPRKGISLAKTARKDVELFMKHYVRRLAKALLERPVLYVELLFTKMPDTLFFIKHGYDEEKQPKRKREYKTKTDVDNTNQESGSEDGDADDAMSIIDDESYNDVEGESIDAGEFVKIRTNHGTKRQQPAEHATSNSSRKSKKVSTHNFAPISFHMLTQPRNARRNHERNRDKSYTLRVEQRRQRSTCPRNILQIVMLMTKKSACFCVIRKTMLRMMSLRGCLVKVQ